MTRGIFFLCCVLVCCASGLSFTLGAKADVSGPAGPAGDPLFRILGTAKEALGDAVYMQADSYLHGGLRADILAKHQEDHKMSSEEYDKKAFERAITGGWINRAYAQVNVVQHTHMEGAQSKEMLPILDLSTRLNPRNVNAVLSTSYWFRSRFKDDDKAIKMLERAIRENPDSWEIQYELGCIYLDNKNFDPAIEHLSAAVRMMDTGEGPKFDPIRVRYSLAEAYDGKGDWERALALYNEVLALYPEGSKSALKGIVQGRIKQIQSV